MNDDLDDFQTDYLVPLTPEEDRHFAGCFGPTLTIIAIVLGLLLLASFLGES